MIVKLRVIKPQPQQLQNYFIKQVAKSHNFSQKFVYIINMLHNRMNACWWCNEAIELHVCKLSAMGKRKFKADHVEMHCTLCAWFSSNELLFEIPIL